MRLTNITHAALPQGQVSSCSLVAHNLGAQLPVSFDQGMHVGRGDRPGSWMAVAFDLPGPATRDELGQAWLQVIARHQSLRTVFTDDGAGLVLHEVAAPWDLTWREHAAGAGDTRAVLNSVLDKGCSPLARPAHRLCLIDAPEAPTVVLAADHAHLDAWSLPILVHDFLTALAVLRESGTEAATAGPRGLPGLESSFLASAAPFSEHTTELAQSPASPRDIAARWNAILETGDGNMPKFPLPLGQLEPTPQETVTTRDVLDRAQLAAFESRAAEHGHRPLTVLVSAMTRAMAQLAGCPLRAVLPVHSRTADRWRDSVGWFITNSVLESSDPDLSSCRTALREALRLGSCALEPIMRPYGGMPVPPGMFMISYLDYRRLPATVPEQLNAQHISASAPTDGVQVWFVADEAGLHLRARYPDTPEARESVSCWLSAVTDHLGADQLTAGTAGTSRARVTGDATVIGQAGESESPVRLAPRC